MNGVDVGACGPLGGNLNLNPDYGMCLELQFCDWWDPQGISLSSFLFMNGGGNPDSEVSGASQSDSAQGGDYVDFAHGTTSASRDDIIKNGLDNSTALDKTLGAKSPGSFFTVRVDPSDRMAALETAAFWGRRHGGDVCVVVCRLPGKVVSQLEAEGSLVHTDIPYQSVFLPKAFATVNRYARWLPVGG